MHDDSTITNLRRTLAESNLIGLRPERQSYLARATYDRPSTFTDPLKNLFHPRSADLKNTVECRLNEDDYYGTRRGDQYNVKFLYQIHVAPNTRRSALRVLMLPALDAAMATSLLPDFFDCEKRSPLTTIQAIDWRPVDQLVETGCK